MLLNSLLPCSFLLLRPAFTVKAELQDVEVHCGNADGWRRTEECCRSRHSVCVSLCVWQPDISLRHYSKSLPANPGSLAFGDIISDLIEDIMTSVTLAAV